MKKNNNLKHLVTTHVLSIKNNVHPFISFIAAQFVLSWFYALCEQVAFPLPFSPVPVLLQPFPLFFLSLVIGWPAVSAYLLYLAQGALGAPFFAFTLGGFARLMGPTGGYLFGMGIAATYLAATRDMLVRSRTLLLGKLIVANALLYSVGLTWLFWFIPSYALLDCGLWPFMPGCFIKMTAVILLASPLLSGTRQQ